MKLHEATFAVTNALERRQIDYVLVGGQAAIFHGVGRTTLDADLVVQLRDARLVDVFAELGRPFHFDPQRRFEIFTGKECYEVEIVGTLFKIEFFLLSDDAFDQEAFRRRRREMMHGHPVFLATAEDVLINKLRWQRAKDIADAEEILSMQRDVLDWSYLERWCDAHGSRKLLDDLRHKLPPL